MKRIEKRTKRKEETILYIVQPILISRQSARATFCTQLNPTANINYGRAKKPLIRHRATKLIRANDRGDRIRETRTFGLKLFVPRSGSAVVSRISFNIAIAPLPPMYVRGVPMYEGGHIRGMHTPGYTCVHGRARTTNRFRDGRPTITRPRRQRKRNIAGYACGIFHAIL